jgi:Kef-type K+ transport system membrane component KefB
MTHTLLYLLIDLVIIIVAARTFGQLARMVGQPSVIGEIVAGILLGPSLLGKIAPDFQRELFPPDVPLRSIADLGLIFFMFLVGLELDTRLIRAEGRRAIQISLSGIVLPLAAGLVIGYLVYDVNNSGQFLEGTDFPPRQFVFALFLGAAMCITAFPVLARILVETRLYKTPVGAAALCAAAVDDVFAWIVLAAVVGLATSGTVAEAVPALLLTLVFVAFMVTVGRRLLSLLATRYDREGRLSVDMVAIILAGVLLSAYATERIGIHAIFGAFIFGAVMPQRSGMTRELTDKVEDFTVIVLLPVFFLVAGLRTDLFTLDSPSLIGWLLLILAAAIGGKFLGCGIAARLTGISTRDSVVVGALMNTRGLTELVILSIGLSLGVLSDRTFAMMVIMALVTTFMAAPIVNRLYPRERVLRELEEVEGAPLPGAAMRVLTAIGNPVNAPALVDAAIRLTGGKRPAELLLVRLIPTSRAPEFRTGLRDEESQIDASIESMRELTEQAAAAGVSARPISFLSDDVGRDLARLAADQSCDAILLGWHRASLERQVIRALVHRVMALARCQVVVFVDRWGRGIVPDTERPVVAVLSATDQDAAVAATGAQIAASMGVGLRLLGYLRADGAAPSAGDSERLALQADRLRQESGVWVVPRFVESEVTGAAVEESGLAAVAVIGLGKGWPESEDFGNPTSTFAAEAACPVLVVRAAASVGDGAGRTGTQTATGLSHARR